ncbi:MAG: hypothetical protein H0T78_08830 [Longispora sp.]|nr:hypothetical protein [Longispora sp. (in: high G+C Gram-positive bacteria)]
MNALIAQYRLRIYPDARGVTHAYSPQQMAYVLQLHSGIQQLGAHFSLSEQEQATMVEALNSGSLVYVELHNGANLPSISAQQVSVYPGSRIMDVNGGRVNVYGGTVNAVNNATVSKVTGGTVDIVSSVTVKGFTDGCIAGGRMGRVSIEVVTVYIEVGNQISMHYVPSGDSKVFVSNADGTTHSLRPFFSGRNACLFVVVMPFGH